MLPEARQNARPNLNKTKKMCLSECVWQPQFCVNEYYLILTWHPPPPLTRSLLSSRSPSPQRRKPRQLVGAFMFPWSWSLQLPVSPAALHPIKARALSTLTERVIKTVVSYWSLVFFIILIFFKNNPRGSRQRPTIIMQFEPIFNMCLMIWKKCL